MFLERQEDGVGVGAPWTLLVPQMQVGNYQVILNTPEIDLKTGRTNSMTKGSKGATMKKVGSEEMQFGRETDHGH